MPREKIKFALRIAPEVQQLVKDMCPRDNCQTQNEFIEKAIKFYAGYISGQDACDFLPEAVVAALRATVRESEAHTCRLLFKLAVEVDILMHVLASGMEIDSATLDKLRGRCVQEVKTTNGGISFKDAVNYQNGL